MTTRTAFASRPFLLAVTLLALLAMDASATPPGQLQVAGTLGAAGGGAVSDGAYKLVFSIYGSETAKDAAWSETAAQVAVIGGRFHYTLGINKPVSATLLAGLKAPHMGVRVGADPELSRVPLTSVAYALHAGHADGLACSGCIKAAQLAPGSVSADKVGFTYAGAKTKGGPATKALDLACTGCVSVAEMSFDGDIDLGGNALKAKSVVAGTMSAQAVSATAFIGDGSKLTGIKTAAGSCKGLGEVVKGVAADGSLQCVKIQAGLPPDGLDEVSNGQLSNEFDHKWALAKAVPIPDNNPIGIGADLVVADVGLAKSLKVVAKISNSDISKLTVMLFDPNNAKYVLHDKTGKGKTISTSWPTPTKPVSGDLGSWLGKNPKGKWRLRVIDSAFTNNQSDGAIDAWTIEVTTISGKQVAAKGKLLVESGVDFLSSGTAGFRFEVAAKAPVACDAAHVGYVWYDKDKGILYLCDGKGFQAIAQVSPGMSQESPGKSCLDLRNKGAVKNGVYWLNPTGKAGAAYQVWCDMVTDGGGWTLIMRFKNDATLAWGSAYWTNTSLFNQGKLDAGENANAKFASFTTVTGSTLRGCKGTNTGCQKQAWSGAKTAHTLFGEGYKSGNMSRNTLVSLFGNDPNQPNCNKSGINANFTYGGARLGLVGNNENDCNTCDSGWGWGTYGKSNKASGCGCGMAGWQAANKCYQGTLWIR